MTEPVWYRSLYGRMAIGALLGPHGPAARAGRAVSLAPRPQRSPDGDAIAAARAALRRGRPDDGAGDAIRNSISTATCASSSAVSPGASSSSSRTAASRRTATSPCPTRCCARRRPPLGTIGRPLRAARSSASAAPRPAPRRRPRPRRRRHRAGRRAVDAGLPRIRPPLGDCRGGTARRRRGGNGALRAAAREASNPNAAGGGGSARRRRQRGTRAPESGGDEVAALARSFNRMAAELEARVRELKASDRLRRQLLADVSHELMTPLTAMRGYLETLALPGRRARRRDAGPVSARRDRGDVAARVDRRRPAGSGAARRRRLGARIAKPCPWTGCSRVSPSGTRWRCGIAAFSSIDEIAPGAERVDGDARRLEQVLQNLAANAVRHTPSGGRIALSAEPRERPGRDPRQRHRDGHRRRASAVRLRSVLQGRRVARAGRRAGQRPGPVDRQGDRRGPRRPDLRLERARTRGNVRDRPRHAAEPYVCPSFSSGFLPNHANCPS